MERIHQLTKEFMTTAGQTVRETPSIPTIEEMKLRLTLEFEELFEKAQAMGLEGSFQIIIGESMYKRALEVGAIDKIQFAEAIAYIRQSEEENLLQDTGVVNLNDVFDAALDQRVVASGTDLCFGFQHIIPAGDEEISRSNMSKFDLDQWNADKTYEKYQEQGIETECHIVGDYFVCKRSSDKKVLKSHMYSPADLGGILAIGETMVGSEDITQSENSL